MQGGYAGPRRAQGLRRSKLTLEIRIMAKVMANSESTSESDPHGQHQVVSPALKRGRSSLHLDKVQCDGNLEQPDAAKAEGPEDEAKLSLP